MPSYTARELERESGFDRRTIAYYVQERLLPKVGRRGPRTRYPQLFLDRLLFIRRVREAEEEGTVPPLSLSDLREVFERIPPSIIARVAAERIAVTPELVSSPSTAFRLPGMAAREADASPRGPAARSRRRASARLERMESALLQMREPVAFPMEMAPGDADAAGTPPDEREARSYGVREDSEYSLREEREYSVRSLARLLAEAESMGKRHRGTSGNPVETWSRIRVSPNIELSVRGLSEEDRSLAEILRDAMRRLIQRAGLASSSDPESDEEDPE